MPVIPALRRWGQEDQKFKVSLIYIASSRPSQESMRFVFKGGKGIFSKSISDCCIVLGKSLISGGKDLGTAF